MIGSTRLAKVGWMSVATLALVGSARYATADTITITNGDFSQPTVTGTNSPTIADWTQNGGTGLINDANYGPSDPGPNGTTQGAYINHGVNNSTNAPYQISQTVGTVSDSTYTLQFYLSGDAGNNQEHTEVAFVDGANGDALATSAPLLGTGLTYTQYDVPLTIMRSAGDQVGDPLVLVFFVNQQPGDTDFQSFLADVSVVSAPEPASLGLIGLSSLGLLARRRRSH